MRDACGILEVVDTVLVAFELADDGCLQIYPVAVCLGTGGKDFAFELLFGRVQFVMEGSILVMKGADIHSLRMLFFKDRADSFGYAGEEFPSPFSGFVKGLPNVVQSFDVSLQRRLSVLQLCNILLKGFEIAA